MKSLSVTKNKELLSELLHAVAGDLIYTLGFNLLIVPVALYSGGFMGIAQLIYHFLTEIVGIYVPASLNLTGILYYVMNIPIFHVSNKL